MLNRKIAISAVSIFAAFALIAGGTFAFFSSTASSTSNAFGSGSLTLQLDDLNEVTPAATVSASIGDSNLVPGATVSGFISMHNGGSTAIAEVNLSSDETVTSSPDLAGKLNITSAVIDTVPACDNAPQSAGLGAITLADLNSDVDGIDMTNSGLAASATKYLCLTLQLDSSTDNTYQAKSITETFNFVGHQDLSQ